MSWSSAILDTYMVESGFDALIITVVLTGPTLIFDETHTPVELQDASINPKTVSLLDWFDADKEYWYTIVHMYC